jgi:hypothetical protein
VEQWTLPVWCHLFPQTLTGAARAWFESLPNGRIDSFEDLQKQFSQQFGQQRRQMKSRFDVFHIRRRDHESIESFVARYNKESLQIAHVDNSLMIAGSLLGIKDDELQKKLHEPQEGVPTTWKAVMDIAHKHIRQIKSVSLSKTSNPPAERSTETPEQKTARKNKQHGRGGPSPVIQQVEKSESRQPRAPRAYSAITPGGFPSLSKTPAAVFATENLKFQTPRPLRDSPNQDQSKYCEYHKGNGHLTNECWQLKRQIEEFVKAGKLSHLQVEEKPGPSKTNEDKTAGKRPREIDMVSANTVTGVKRFVETLEPWMEVDITLLARRGNLSLDALVITGQVGGYRMRRMLVDTGSSEDIIYEACFNRMTKEDQELLQPWSGGAIKGFAGESIVPMGQITFAMTLGTNPKVRTILVDFLVIPAPSQHNVILGRYTLGRLDALLSTARSVMMFPTPQGVTTIAGERFCSVVEDGKRPRQTPTGLTGPEKWALNPKYPDQLVTIGSSITHETRTSLKKLLQESLDVFAFEHSDMTGIPREEAEHKLSTLPGIKPVAQKKRSMGQERRDAVVKEVRKLVEAGILKEAKYPTWIANPVMVKKPDGSWRMCVDYKDLNSACPKDAYPLPEIDLKVDSLAQFQYKCFLDA